MTNTRSSVPWVIIASLLALLLLAVACGTSSEDALPASTPGGSSTRSDPGPATSIPDSRRAISPTAARQTQGSGESSAERNTEPVNETTAENRGSASEAQPTPRQESAESDVKEPQNICARTPEVQDVLLQSLGSATCREIFEEELFRIRTLQVEARTIGSDDLAGLFNLEDLTVVLEQAPPSGAFRDLQALMTLRASFDEPPETGTFTGMHSLETMVLRVEVEEGEWSAWNIFTDLPNLIQLHIISPNADVILIGGEAFAELSGLEILHVDGPARLEADSLYGLDNLTTLQITGSNDQAWLDTDPMIPEELLEPLPNLQEMAIFGYYSPEEIRVNSLEVLCHLERYGRATAPGTTLVTPQGPAHVLEIQQVGNKTFCVVQLQDGTEETLEIRESKGSGEAASPAQTPEPSATPEPVDAQIPLSVAFVDSPENHEGEGQFKVRIFFSEPIEISYKDLRDHSFSVSGGSIIKANRVDRRSDLWEITVRPDSNKKVVITLEGNRDCGSVGAICTDANKRLGSSATLIVDGLS